MNSARTASFRWALAVVVGAAYLSLRLWLIQNRYIMVDETEHLHAAWSIAQGLRLYKDFFEHHGPVLYWILQPIVWVFHDPVKAFFAGRFLMMFFWFGILASSLYFQKTKLNGTESLIFLFLLCSYTTFARFSLEIRPDVPAVLWMCLLFCTAARLTGKRKYVVIGALFTTGLFTSPKMLFPMVGYLIGTLCESTFQSKQPPVDLLKKAGGMILGAMVPILAVCGYFYFSGSLADFYKWFIVFNRHLLPGPYDAWSYFIGSVTENPLLWGLALIGFFQERSNLPLKGALASALLGLLFVKPMPLGQYYLFLGPLLAVFASYPIYGLVRSIPKTPDNRYVLGAIVIGLFFSFYKQYEEGRITNHDRIASIRSVMKLTAPNDKILSFWAGDAVFRPHADFYCWLCPDVEETLGIAFINAKLLSVLGSPACRGVIWDEHFLKDHPMISRYILQNYKRSACHRLYLR